MPQSHFLTESEQRFVSIALCSRKEDKSLDALTQVTVRESFLTSRSRLRRWTPGEREKERNRRVAFISLDLRDGTALGGRRDDGKETEDQHQHHGPDMR